MSKKSKVEDEEKKTQEEDKEEQPLDNVVLPEPSTINKYSYEDNEDER